MWVLRVARGAPRMPVLLKRRRTAGDDTAGVGRRIAEPVRIWLCAGVKLSAAGKIIMASPSLESPAALRRWNYLI